MLKPRISFTTPGLLICLAVFNAVSVKAADVLLDAVLKLQRFQQLSAGAPTTPPAGGFSFQAFVIGSSTNLVTNATVRLPSGAIKTLLPETSLNLRFEEYFNSAATLDAAYPHNNFFGVTYQMRMQSVNDGLRSNNCAYAALLLLGGYPTTPQVAAANWSAAQQIDHTRGFTLQWNYLGGNTLDVVQVLVEQNETNIFYVSPLPFTAGALNGASNSVTIPGYSLPPATNLNAHILVFHVAGIPDTNYAAGVALLGKETVFPMQTRPAPVSPDLKLLARTGGETQMLLLGEANRTYQIQATDNWTNWMTLITTNPAAGNFFFADLSPTNVSRFYRGRVGD